MDNQNHPFTWQFYCWLSYKCSVSPLLCTWTLCYHHHHPLQEQTALQPVTCTLKGKKVLHPNSHRVNLSLFWGKKSHLTERKQGHHKILLSVPSGLLNQLKTLMLSQEHLPQPTESYHPLPCSFNASFSLFACILWYDFASHAKAQHLPMLTSQGSRGFSSAHDCPGARICPLSAARTDNSLEEHTPTENEDGRRFLD